MIKEQKVHDHSRLREGQVVKNLMGPTLEQLYEKEVVCLKASDTVFEAARFMLEKHIGDIVIVEGDGENRKPIGIVTDRDIVITTTAQNRTPDSVRLAEMIGGDLITAQDSDTLSDLVTIMTESGISRLPIVDSSGKLKGILSSKRLFQYFSQGLCELSSLSEQQQQREHEKAH